MPSAWTRLRAAADPLARRLNAYTAYSLTPDEYVGRIDGDVRAFLRSHGYEPQYLSAAKRHPETNALHDLSYRRVPTAHPAGVTTALTRNWRPAQCQYHVHVFGHECFSHYELRPDFWPPNPRRLREHYRPTAGSTYLRGVTDLDL